MRVDVAACRGRLEAQAAHEATRRPFHAIGEAVALLVDIEHFVLVPAQRAVGLPGGK